MDVSFEQFAAIDIRSGTIVTAEPSTKAKKPAYKLVIDLGALGQKQSSAQLTERYTAQALIGLQVLVVVNFAPRQVADVISEVLVLGVVDLPGGTLLLQPTQAIANGVSVG